MNSLMLRSLGSTPVRRPCVCLMSGSARASDACSSSACHQRCVGPMTTRPRELGFSLLMNTVCENALLAIEKDMPPQNARTRDGKALHDCGAGRAARRHQRQGGIFRMGSAARRGELGLGRRACRSQAARRLLAYPVRLACARNADSMPCRSSPRNCSARNSISWQPDLAS